MTPVTMALRWLDPERSSDLADPVYATEGAAGMDVGAAITDPVSLAPGDIRLIPCGFAVAIPQGYELQVRPRSGLAVRFGVTVVNAPGTIDADYRGEIKVALINLGQTPYTVHRGDRVAQLVLAPVARAIVQVVTELAPTARGGGGFGHTGLRAEMGQPSDPGHR